MASHGLPPPSAEQQAIVDAVLAGANVAVQAVAGAGKSTTLLHCAAARGGAALLLTYNKRLQLEVAQRALRVPGLEVRTYHAAAGRAYGRTIRDDAALREAVAGPPAEPPAFGLLMLDEAQDMTRDFYLLARHFLRANAGARLVVAGDAQQAINGYRGAHAEFLTEAPRLYDAAGPWARLGLSTSYRLTPATAAFVNRHLFRAPLVVGGNLADPSVRPHYLAAPYRQLAAALGRAVLELVRRYGAASVFVLVASVKNLAPAPGAPPSPLALLVRDHLAGVPTFVSRHDGDECADEALTANKLAILTFNASKGCERDHVLVLLDEAYFKYYAREWTDPQSLPNVLTVAATRARRRLYIVAEANRTLRTIDLATLRRDAQVVGAPTRRRAPTPLAACVREIPVTALCRQLSPATVARALALVRLARPAPAPRPAGARCLVAFDGPAGAGRIHEDLAFAYGVVPAVLAEVARTGTVALDRVPDVVPLGGAVDPFEGQIARAVHDAPGWPPEFWERVSEAGGDAPAERSLEDWFRLVVVDSAVREGRYHIARQVRHYDWIDADATLRARDAVLAALAGRDGAFERVMPEAVVAAGAVTYRVRGRADFVERGGRVWELKYKAEPSAEDLLQLACYVALAGGGVGTLFAILGEPTELAVDAEDADALLRVLAGGYDAPTEAFEAALAEARAIEAGEPAAADDELVGLVEATGPPLDVSDLYD